MITREEIAQLPMVLNLYEEEGEEQVDSQIAIEVWNNDNSYLASCWLNVDKGDLKNDQHLAGSTYLLDSYFKDVELVAVKNFIPREMEGETYVCSFEIMKNLAPFGNVLFTEKLTTKEARKVLQKKARKTSDTVYRKSPDIRDFLDEQKP